MKFKKKEIKVQKKIIIVNNISCIITNNFF